MLRWTVLPEARSSAAVGQTLRRALAIALLLVLPWIGLPTGAHAQDVTLRGFVTDRSTGQALAGANVALLEAAPSDAAQRVARGTAANADGLYQLAGVTPGRYVLRVSYVGYVPALDTLRLGTRALVQRSVALRPAEDVLGEVVVADEQAGAARLEAGQQRIRPVDLARVPTPSASGDLATYLQSLPSVVSLGDRGGQLYVRGGTPDQNLVLIDNALIYQPFHIVGFFSAFPQELVQSADLYAGGFGAEYTGRISSVIDVKMRAGNKERFAGGAQIGPFLTGLRVEGPLTADGELSLIGSVRRSVIEETAPTVLGQEQPLAFSDIYAKLDHRGSTSNCALTAMRTHDRGRIDPERDAVFRWANTTLGGRCLAFAPNFPVTADASLGVSHLNNEVGAAGEPERSSSITRFHTDVDLSYPLAPNTEVHGGFRARYIQMDFDLAERFTGVRLDANVLLRTGVYAGADVALGKRLDVNPSVAVMVLGLRPTIEPRLRVTWRPFGREAQQLSGALGLYRQTMVGISDERDAGSVFRAWLPAPVDEAQPQALHAILGWQQRFGPEVPGLDALDVSVEGYYKRLSDLAVPTWSSFARFTTELDRADGDVYGFDVRAALEKGPIYGRLSYGYSRTQYGFSEATFGGAFGDAVQSYHPPHDQRHTLTALLSAERGAWAASLRWEFGSGRPYTRPFGFDSQIVLDGLPDVRTDRGNGRVLFEQAYGARLPTYHRLDASLGRTFDLGVAELAAKAGAINLYNRRNLFYYDVFTFTRTDQLPFVPYLSLSISTP